MYSLVRLSIIVAIWFFWSNNDVVKIFKLSVLIFSNLMQVAPLAANVEALAFVAVIAFLRAGTNAD